MKELATMKGKSILVVDDEQNILDCLARDLRLAGLEVTTARDGAEAIAQINAGGFDLVTTDLLMPGSDGFQVIKAAKQKGAEIMVIILTGNETSEAAVDSFHFGADDFVRKPCDSDELLWRMSNCFEKQDLFNKIDRYEKLLTAWHHCQRSESDQVKSRARSKGASDFATCLCQKCYTDQVGISSAVEGIQPVSQQANTAGADSAKP